MVAEMFGLSAPVLVAILVSIVVFFIYVLPLLFKSKPTTDYKNFDWKSSVAHHHFGGVGGPGYHNLRIKEAPATHINSKATMWLEGLPHAFTNLNINPLSPDCNFKIKITADSAFGTRIDVYWNVDANGNVQQWDNMLVQDWTMYANKLGKSAKSKLMVTQLAEKEFNDEIKGVADDQYNLDSRGIRTGERP